MILFCNPVGVYVHKICEDKFGGWQTTFSWLGQKVNKRIDVYGTMEVQNSNLKPLNIRIRFVFEISSIYSIRMKFQICLILISHSPNV